MLCQTHKPGQHCCCVEVWIAAHARCRHACPPRLPLTAGLAPMAMTHSPQDPEVLAHAPAKHIAHLARVHPRLVLWQGTKALDRQGRNSFHLLQMSCMVGSVARLLSTNSPFRPQATQASCLPQHCSHIQRTQGNNIHLTDTGMGAHVWGGTAVSIT